MGNRVNLEIQEEGIGSEFLGHVGLVAACAMDWGGKKLRALQKPKAFLDILLWLVCTQHFFLDKVSFVWIIGR